MWNTDDCVLAGGHPPAMLPVASALPIEELQLDSWQVIVVWVDETLAGDFSEQESPCDSQNRRRPMDMNNSLNSLVHTVVQGGPVSPQRKEPLAMLVLEHADPVGQYVVVQEKVLGPAGLKVKEPLTLLVLMNNSLTSLVHNSATHEDMPMWTYPKLIWWKGTESMHQMLIHTQTLTQN